MSRALLIVVSGPAGSGKTTLCSSLTGACPQGIRRVITCTTRAPRPGEVDGVDYHFLTRESFEQQVAAGVFLEHAHVHGNLYGPRAADVAAHLGAGFDALLNVDVQGAATIRANVVVPVPGGPHRIIEPTRSSSIARRSGRPGPTSDSWPTTSSRSSGRRRSGSGATRRRRSSAAVEKRSLMHCVA